MRFNYNNIPIQWIYKLSNNNLEYEDHVIYNTKLYEAVCIKGNLGVSFYDKKTKRKKKK